MKEFHRDYVLKSTVPDKKDRKTKNQSKEPCKCFAPFVKLHYYDCPVVKRSCPIHGNNRHHAAKAEKGDPDKNMIISFHPSSKTERLFQPVKTLLAQCNPDTKVNLQYYSPKSTNSKESVKHQEVQTKPEDGRKALNSSVFVEKTKSFVADKTNKMKKLKQCFHSPCNSIIHKSCSQTSIRDKFQDIFCDDRKKTYYLDKSPIAPKYDTNLAWFPHNFHFKELEKLSAGKTDSDFITVTQQAKNNLINHKIFEIRHKKGLNDYPIVRLPERPSHMVYSSIGVDRPLSKTPDDPEAKNKILINSPPSEGNPPQQKRDEELSGSENSSSSSSVYFTPFIFVPTVSDSDGKLKNWEGEVVPVGSKDHGDGKTQTPSLESEQEVYPEEPKTASVLMQTDPDRQSGDSTVHEWYLRPLDVAESFTTRGTQTDESLFRLDKGVGDSRHLSELSSEVFMLAGSKAGGEYRVQGTQTSGSPTEMKNVRGRKSVIVQTEKRDRQERQPVATTTWTMTTLDKVVQTESCNVLEVERLWSFKVNKSQMAAPKLSNKTTQTIFTRSESLEEVSEFIDLDSSNVTLVMKQFGNEESDQAIDKLAKAWWGKSHSDSELLGSRRCGCPKPEYVIPLTQGCSCYQSETTRESTTPGKSDQKNNVNFSSSKTIGSSKRKVYGPDSRADKSLGTEDGSRTYKRADKALGTDSGTDVPPSGKADKALGTDSGVMKTSKRADKALGTDKELLMGAGTSRGTEKPSTSRNTGDYASKGEQTSFLGDCPPTSPLSDLSELTKLIQEFFEKTGKQALKSCPWESSTVSDRRTETTMTTTESRKIKKEYVDHGVGGHSVNERKADSEAIANPPRKPRKEFANAETQAPAKGPATDMLGDPLPTDRVKIRRSVLLDDKQTKTRFVCSVCAREISTFSINAATNTENPQSSPQKKEKTTEVSEIVKVKTVRTVQSMDNPKTTTTSSESGTRPPTNHAKTTTPSAAMTQPPRQSSKTNIPKTTATSFVKDRSTQPISRDSLKRIANTTFSRPTIPKFCICEQNQDICAKESCPHQDAIPGTSGAAPSTAQGRGPNTQTRSNRYSSDKTRTQRRNPEAFYPVLVQSLWPRDFTWNMADKSQSSILEDSPSATLQQKRSYDRETDTTEPPAEKKIKAEADRSSEQYLFFGDGNSQDLHMGDRIFIPNKAGFIVIQSMSTSSVDPPKKHKLSQSKMIKSEQKVQEATQQQGLLPPEGLNGPSDLCSTQSCRLAPLQLECDDKLFECRVCKSLTVMKNDRDGVVFRWRHGLLTCRPTGMQCPNPTERQLQKDDSESLQQNESSTQNIDECLEVSSQFSERSDSPSPYDLLQEEAEESTDEEPEKAEVKGVTRGECSTLDDLFKATTAVSSKSFNRFWTAGHKRKN